MGAQGNWFLGRSKIMHWASVSEFFNMGGHALYVWGSYGVTVVFMVGEVIALILRKRTITQRLGRMMRITSEAK